MKTKIQKYINNGGRGKRTSIKNIGGRWLD